MLRVLWMLILAAWMGWAAGTVVDYARAASDKPLFSTWGWKTNFEKHSVPYEEILSGGPPKDGIPAVDNPKFVSQKKGRQVAQKHRAGRRRRAQGRGPRLPASDPDLARDRQRPVERPSGLRDVLPPVQTRPSPSNRRLDGRLLDFGTTGKLRNSDLVMYDRQTESWWQQFTGEAIIGDLLGKQLNMVPASIVGYGHFKKAHPGGSVLSRKTGFTRAYGRNPYTGYDDIRSIPFLYRGPKDDRLPPMERVVAVTIGKSDKSLSLLGPVEETGRPRQGGRAGRRGVSLPTGPPSALDGSSIADSRDVGATGVFDPNLNGKKLTFRSAKDGITDKETGSRWDILGRAIREGSSKAAG